MLGNHQKSRLEIVGEIYSYLNDFHKDFIIAKDTADADGLEPEPNARQQRQHRSSWTIVLQIR